jgi:hypothetical protein
MIEAKTRLIPVVIDDCDIPASLQPRLQIRVKNLADIDAAVDDVVATVTGGRDKPALGILPGYTAFTDFVLPELTQIDNLVLKTACDMVLERGHYMITGQDLWERIEGTGVPESVFTDALEALAGRRLLKTKSPHHTPMHSIFDVQLHAFDQYLKRTYPDYAQVSRSIAAEAANTRNALNHDIREKLGLPQVVVDHVLLQLERQGKLTLSKTLPNYIRVVTVSVDLKRALR